MATVLRFVVLDEHKGNGFTELRQSIEKTNKSIGRNNTALKAQAGAATTLQGKMLGLAGAVSGFGDAQNLASKKTSMFAKGLAAVNLATGILEPAMAGLIVATGALAAAFAAAGAGAAAYSVALKPLMSETSDVIKAQKQLKTAQQTAQANYQAALKTGTSVQAAAKTRQQALTVATQKYHQAVKGVPPTVRRFAQQVTKTQDAYKSWANSLARPVLKPLSMALRLVHPILRAISPLVRAAAGAFKTLVGELGAKIRAGGLTNVVQKLLPHVRTTILDLAHAFGNVAAGIWGVLKAFLPMSGKMTGGVEKLTAKFKEWGQSLPSHSGFKSLMSMFKTQTPAAAAVLKNLALIIKNVAAATVGLATPGNSKALLNILGPLTQIIAKLSQNQALVRFVLYALILNASLKKVGLGFKAATVGLSGFIGAGRGLTNLTRGFSNLESAASATTGTMGTVGGALRNAFTWFKKTTVATKIAAAAQWLWNAALTANPIGLIIVALAALGVAFYLLWTKSKTFRKIVTGVWNAVWSLLKNIWAWIKHNWPLLLAILTGPFGLAALFIIKHWKTLTKVFQTLWQGAIKAARTALAWFVDKVLGFFGTILHGAVAMFGWVPGVGGKLRKASDEFDKFRDRVNKSIKGVNGGTVHVKAIFGAGVGKGQLWHLAGGGPIKGPGGDTGDRVPAMLSNNEYVVKAQAHKKYGTGFLNAVNAGRFASGGPVGGEIRVKADTPSTAQIHAQIGPVIGRMAVAFVKHMMGSGQAIASYARHFATGQGHPYVWGGTTPNGWDCSGFTGYVYKHFGYRPPRTSQQQQLWARPAPQQPGALVFFYGTGGQAAHVGIALGNGRMVNASSPAVGTIISGVGGNTGFGIPPSGFHGAGFAGGGGGPAANIELGRAMAQAFGWGGRQFSALRELWMRESGWSSTITNPSSGAAGIAQRISGWGPGYQRGNARQQIAWGLRYILNRQDERTPIGALAHENQFGWYARGTSGAAPGWAVVGERGPELVRMRGGETVLPHAATARIAGYARGTKDTIAEQVHRALRIMRQRPHLPVLIDRLHKRLSRLSGRIGDERQLLGHLHGAARRRVERELHHDEHHRRGIRRRLRDATHDRGIVQHAGHSLAARDRRLVDAITAAHRRHMPKVARRLQNQLSDDKGILHRLHRWLSQVARERARQAKERAARKAAEKAAEAAAKAARANNKVIRAYIRLSGAGWSAQARQAAATALGMTGPMVFDRGGWLMPGATLAVNNTGRPERVGAPMGHVTYNITVQVPPHANQASIGRQIVHSIQQFEKSSGTRWRK